MTGDGNLLLDVGPMPDGRIEPRQVTVLRQTGAWLAKYGESIYGTRGGPIANGAWGGSTRKGNLVYLHILKWGGNEVTLPPLKARVRRAQALTGGKVDIVQSEDSTVVRMSARDQSTVDTVIKLETQTR